MPYTEVCTYAIYVTLPKGVTVSSGVPGTNGEFVVTITASADTQGGAAKTLVDGLSRLGAALSAEGIAV